MLVIALAGAACSGRKDQPSVAKSTAEGNPPIIRVAVLPAQRVPLVSELALTAEFRADQEVDVMAKVGGYLQKIEVDAGAFVQHGQLLATIEVPEMADEQAKNEAAISRSRAELERARLDVTRAQTAREMTQLSYSRLAAVMEKRPGLVAQQEIDTVRNRDLIAQSQIATSQSTLAASEQSIRILEAEAARLKTMQSYLRVTAPFAGVVTKRYVDTGAMIQAGSSSQGKPIVRIAQVHKLRLILPVPEAAVPRLRLGMPVDVRVDSLHRTFTGRIARFSNHIQTATRTMETEVDVPNQGGVLFPGMFAQAQIRLEDKRAVLSVPLEAVERAKEGATVLVVSPNQTLEARELRLGMETAERVEVVAGLADGDLVVVGNRSQLRAGQKVDPKRLDSEGSQSAAKGGRG